LTAQIMIVLMNHHNQNVHQIAQGHQTAQDSSKGNQCTHRSIPRTECFARAHHKEIIAGQ